MVVLSCLGMLLGLSAVRTAVHSNQRVRQRHTHTQRVLADAEAAIPEPSGRPSWRITDPQELNGCAQTGSMLCCRWHAVQIFAAMQQLPN